MQQDLERAKQSSLFTKQSLGLTLGKFISTTNRRVLFGLVLGQN